MKLRNIVRSTLRYPAVKADPCLLVTLHWNTCRSVVLSAQSRHTSCTVSTPPDNEYLAAPSSNTTRRLTTLTFCVPPDSKTGHPGDILRSQSVSTVAKILNWTQQKQIFTMADKVNDTKYTDEIWSQTSRCFLPYFCAVGRVTGRFRSRWSQSTLGPFWHYPGLVHKSRSEFKVTGGKVVFLQLKLKLEKETSTLHCGLAGDLAEKQIETENCK